MTPYSRKSAAARYATLPNPDLATHGPHVDKVAAALGHPSMPWQRQVNRVANEIVSDGAGGWRYRYGIVLVTTPRRAGKTTLLGSNKVQRCLTMEDYRCRYTAQSGLDARDTWREWQGMISSAMPGRWKFRLSNGEESATWPGTRSFIRTFPPTPDALHGKATDMPALDEVWSWTLAQGGSLTQAVVPTMATRPHSQLWILSTAGDESSLWFRGWVERGLASLGDPDTDIAFFDWSCPPDLDVTDPASWPLFHPAYGVTINDRAMRAALDAMGPEQFARAFGNQWPAVEASWRAGWPALASGDRIPPDARVYLAVDAQTSHRTATITAAAPLPDGRIAVEIVDARTGVDWLPARLGELARRHRAPIGVKATGPLGYLIPQLRQAGVRVTELSATDYADAAGRFRTLIVSGGIAHPADPRLDAAVDGTETAVSGDRVVWRKKDPATDETPLVAASLSVWQAVTAGPRPAVRGASEKKQGAA